METQIADKPKKQLVKSNKHSDYKGYCISCRKEGQNIVYDGMDKLIGMTLHQFTCQGCNQKFYERDR